MKIAIHQPEHFPYIGFFQKMKAADIFVILDDVQYTKGNFQNRNKFKNNSSNNDEWFTISLEKKPHHKLIKDVKTNDNIDWRDRITTQLYNKFKIDFSKIYTDSQLVNINLNSINYCRKKLKLSTPMILSSNLNIKTTGSQKLSDICDKLKATEYISGQGAKKYLNENIFNCKVSYFTPNISDYYTILQHL